MPALRKQHSVPRFYLRNFAVDDKGRQIGTYSLRGAHFFERTSIRDQACSNLFYDESGRIERGLSRIEDAAAPIVQEILHANSLPPTRSYAFQFLLFFVVTMLLRTETRARVTSNMLRTVLGKALELQYGKKLANSVLISLKHEGSMSFSGLPELFKCIMDMRFFLVANRSTVEFITSDSPAILTNPFARFKGLYRDNCGFRSKGLVILFPLSPFLLLCGMDPMMYRNPVSRQRHVELYEEAAIDDVNSNQILQCSNSVYFHEYERERLIRFVDTWGGQRGELEETCAEVHFAQSETEVTSGFHSTQRIRPKLEATPRFVNLSSEAKNLRVDKGKALVREDSQVRRFLEQFYG
jgi:hypothetical protein